MHVLVELTPAEIFQAAMIGVMRQTQNLKRGFKPGYGSGKYNDWQLHIEGCLGEYAVAKHFGMFYNGNLGNLYAADVGKLQVRTRSKDHYSLILHPKDADNDTFIAVTGVNGKYKLRGFILGKDGKRDEYWSDPAGGRPAYFVPNEALEDIEKLGGNNVRRNLHSPRLHLPTG